MSVQDKNIAWFLPRPKPDRYKGGMPLHAEKWCLNLAREILFGYKNAEADVMNIFCGMNSEGFRVDIKPEVKPDLCCDVHELSKRYNNARNNILHDHGLRKGNGIIPGRPVKFDIIFADPPYSNEEARDIYGTPKLDYMKWTAEAAKLLKPGGLLIVYHKRLMPNPDPKIFSVVKRVCLMNRVNHPPRVIVYFKKKGRLR